MLHLPLTQPADEVAQLSRVLRLSHGDLLQLAREVAEDRRLPSVEHLMAHQRAGLIAIMQSLAEPVSI